MAAVLAVGWALLRQPVVLAALGGVTAVLWGVGRAVGLPTLFWHERARVQTRAGRACALLVAHGLFVLFLLTRGAPFLHEAGDLPRFMAAGGALWIINVAVRAALLARARPEIDAAAPKLVPGFGVPHGSGVRLQVGRVRSGPFVRGTVEGLLAAGALLGAGAWCQRSSAWLNAAESRALAGLPAPVRGWVPGDPELHLVAALIVGVLAAYLWTQRMRLRRVPGERARGASPAVAMCALLALVMAWLGFVAFVTGSAVVPWLVFVALVIAAGRSPYKHQIAALAPLYPEPVPLDPESGAAHLAHDVGFLGAPPGAGDAPMPLILLCTSGGGIRSAAWTGAILERLSQLTGFCAAARLVTGASGGMVGATFWVAHALQEHREGRWPPAPGAPLRSSPLFSALTKDSLSRTVRQLVFGDLLSPFHRTLACDRGQALEEAWLDNARADHGPSFLSASFGDVADGERLGLWPSLVFSPLMVEDGRRLLFSNRNLGPVLQNQSRWIPEGPTLHAEESSSSRSAYQLDELLPGRLTTFPLRTAARLSASFPYVSSAPALPTSPRRRLVDAGYYDNYGLNLACGWLRECLSDPAAEAWFARHVSRVLIIQIRDGVSTLSTNPEGRRERADRHGANPTLPAIKAQSRDHQGGWGAIDELIAPVQAVLAARESVMLFRNDGELEALMRLMTRWRANQPPADGGAPEDFLTTTIFEFKGEASLSWHLTTPEIDSLHEQATSPGITAKLEHIEHWLRPADG